LDALGWDKIIALPAAILVVFGILYFAFRALPIWKEVRLGEIKVRESEALSRVNESGVFGKFSESINLMSGVLKDIVIDQKRDNENARLLQRATADASDKILNKLDSLDEMSARVNENSKRLGNLEDKCEFFETALKTEE